MERKPSFRQFCQDMSNQFLRLPTEHRLRDATGGSVRLAMAFLRPWFHQVVAQDFAEATDTACTLAFNIAQWPAQWWSRDHVEMWSVIRSLVQAVAEEVREKLKSEVTDELHRLQGVVTDLERIVQDYEEAEVASCIYPESETEDEGFMVLPPSPPASLIMRRRQSPLPLTVSVSASVIPDHHNVTTKSSVETTPAEFSELSEKSVAAMGPSTTALELTEAQRSDQTLTAEPRPSESDDPPKARSQLFTEASCIITGILVGAFITLCIVNSTRRTLIYVT